MLCVSIGILMKAWNVGSICVRILSDHEQESSQ